MKKIVPKILPVALLVLAMSVSSVAVSAAALNPEVTYADGKVAVTATANVTTGGDAVILATRQDGTQSAATLENAVANIVYVDQASASNINFNFIPKTDVTGNTISVFMGGAGADAVSVTEIATNNVVMYANGGSIADMDAVDGVYKYNRATGAAYTLPVPVKAGYTFAGWYNNAACTGDAVTAIATTVDGEVSVYAKYTENATAESDTGYCAPTAESADKIGVISVTAKFANVENVTRFGFVVYRADATTTTKTIEATNGTLDANGFFTVVYGIPADYFDTDVVIKPFVATGATDADVTFGEANTYKVNKVGEAPKYLGTVEALEAALGINAAN